MRPIGRVCSEEVPIPYPRHLEEAAIPQAAKISRGCQSRTRAGVTVVVEFRMPSLGADMEAGTLVEWLVKPGDRVKRGDVVAVVETQKGAIEIEIFESGKVERILVELESKVPVGTPLARILTDEEAKSGAAAVAAPSPPVAPAPAAPEIASTRTASDARTCNRHRCEHGADAGVPGRAEARAGARR